MYLREYPESMHEQLVWIALLDSVICSVGTEEVWFLGGIWQNLGYNWMPF